MAKHVDADARRRASKARYAATERGKQAVARYAASPKGKAVKARYRASAKGKEVETRKHRKRRGILNATGERRSGACEICSLVFARLCCDHDSATGAVRGWLCTGCNAALGHLGDDAEGVRRAFNYLERYGQKTTQAVFTS